MDKSMKHGKGSFGAAPIAADPCCVFLVENDPAEQAFSKRELESSPLVKEVKVFSNGEELITYMRAQGFQDHTVMCMIPTIIVIDLNAPGIDGLKVLEMLKSDPFLEDMPIVVISGKLSYETIRHALDLRADGVLRKPMSVEKMQSFLTHGWQWPTREMWMA